MKNKTGHEQISWFSKNESTIACIPRKRLGGISKQKMSAWKVYSDYRNQDKFAKEITGQADFIPVTDQWNS